MEIGARRNVQPGQCLLAFSGLFLFLSIQFLGVGLGLLPQWGEHIIYTRWAAFPFAIRYGSYRLSGVLFLDELPEFPRDVLEVLRQPIEDGVVTVSRVSGSETFPSRFMLVCAMNPCKCGWYGHPSGRCHCTDSEIRRYHSRISGPLLDRIDIIVEVPALEYAELTDRAGGETSADIKKRVNAARAVQRARTGGTLSNAHLGPEELDRCCALSDACGALMKDAFDAMGLTARSYDKILRVARTIADLDGSAEIRPDHLAEAIQYRTFNLMENNL